MDIEIGSSKIVDINSIPKSISFSFYSSEEIRNLASVEIFCPVFFDTYGNIIKGGLCDEKMGIFSRHGTCKLCKGNYSTCPGHSGYIDLPIPVANTFLRNILVGVLQSKCFSCNFFKIESFETTFLCSEIFNDVSKTQEKLSSLSRWIEFTDEKDYLPNQSKLLTFKFIQKFGKKKIKEINCKSIKKKISFYKDQEALNKNRNWSKKLSLFLCSSKKNLECPKCGFNNYNENSNNIIKNLKLIYFKNNTKQFSPCQKIDFDRESFWIINKNEKISFQKKKQDSKGILIFQFKEELENLWKFEKDICRLIWGCADVSKTFRKNNGHHIFYTDSLLLPPNRFRPFDPMEASKIEESVLNNPQNFYYSKILKANQLILLSLAIKKDIQALDFGKKNYLNLESIVNRLGDNLSHKSKKQKNSPNGIKQQLEKKNGIFRMHLMGKRVFHSARSIIIPDPFLKCDEVGVSHKFSTQLTLFEEIQPLNFSLLVNLFYQNLKKSKKIRTEFDIENLIGDKLKIISTNLKRSRLNFLKICCKHAKIFIANEKHFYGLSKITRNLANGDTVLMNRQPSLHRVSVMSHRIKIRSTSKCIKINYCNCASYNADFDGDEMNMHVPQNFFAKTEAKLISVCSNQFKIPVNECPVRGLIQDYILSSVILTRKDFFINSSLLTHLLFFSENFEKLPTLNSCPAILKPKQLWTGKQLISILFRNFSDTQNSMILESRTKFSKLTFGLDETKIILRNGELLRGIVDSSQLGKNKFGILHAFYELYGGEKGDFFLSEIGSILIILLRIVGYTLTTEDLFLLPNIEKYRMIGIRKLNSVSKMYSRKFLSSYGLFCFQKKNIIGRKYSIIPFTRFIFLMNSLIVPFIRIQKNHVTNLFSKNLEVCIPGGLFTRPCTNKFSIITLSGSKGSTLNTYQLSLNLGQTELESKCIPRNIGGKSLPSFPPFDFSVYSNGFISNRFLTGITQSEFFFHCMAGREGLLDTAVKTSQSGYIQRSLIKHLESIHLGYDNSVRFSNGKINQFSYSNDGCSPMNLEVKLILNWSIQNFKKNIVLKNYFNIQNENLFKKKTLFEFSKKTQSLPEAQSNKIRSILKKNKLERKIHPISEIFETVTDEFSEFFFKNLVLPGEAIGILTSQSIGEPCTQMTLNTFHFAGKLASNQKSGISRLKEIVLLSSKFPLTPIMSGKLLPTINYEKVLLIQRRFNRMHINDLLKCSTRYIEKNKNFQGQIIRFILQKKSYYKHLLSLKTCAIKKSMENFISTYKKMISTSSINNLPSEISSVQNFSHLKNKNIKIQKPFKNFASENKNKIELKDNVLEIKFSTYQTFLNLLDIDILFRQDFNVKKTRGISECFVDYRDRYLYVNGINFQALWKNWDIIDLRKIHTNDIYGMMIIYGIEAARHSLFNEIEGIFKVQGISISGKHFDLIADYMTRLGNFRGFNRKGFNEEDGFQKITYETAVNYIVMSTLSNKIDDFSTVSSKLGFGMASNLGTNFFGLSI